MAVIETLVNNTAKGVPGTRKGEPIVRAINQPQLAHESEFGFAFSWTSADADIDIGDSILTIKNTSESFLVMWDGEALPGNIAGKYNILRGNSETDLVGTAVVPVNLNGEFASKTFSHQAKSDETALSDGTIVCGIFVSTVDSKYFRLTGHILGRNDFIQFNQATEMTAGRLTAYGFFIPELQ